jgi:CRP-like cAMP-binding protein
MPEKIGHCFQLKALNECRAGILPTCDFMSIATGADPDLYAKMSASENGRLGRLIVRYPGFPGLDIHSRTLAALMELASDVGVRDDRGMLLRIALTHQQLADLIGASRAKVTRVLGDLERNGMIIRQGRQIAIRS